MPSRFRESLGFIKSMMTETVYHTENESEFIRKYVEKSDVQIDEKLMIEHEQFVHTYPYLPNPVGSGFYGNLYSSFMFIYEIETVLDQIEYYGMSILYTRSLNDLCSVLSVTSTNAMIDIDDGFSFSKKYSLAEDIYIMAKNMHDSMCAVHSVSGKDIPIGESITVSNYDEIYRRLCCKYIRNGIAVLKLFLLLAVLQISPLFTDEVHSIAKKIISTIREVLFDKRIASMVVDSDTRGLNPKAHKSTRLKILFTMGNSDRYCIRLDFPHKGEDSIHLNLNEPGRNQSTGFPFGRDEYEKALEVCGNITVFNSLFYFRDDLYWFRSDFAARSKEIRRDNGNLGQAIDQFHHDRAHLEFSSASKDNMNAVSLFSEAFAEAMVDYADICIYGQTDSSDEEIYKYILFQDCIFDTVIRLRAYETKICIGGSIVPRKDKASELDLELKEVYSKYAKGMFPHDENLINCANQQIDFCSFLSQCLDCLDGKGI